MFVKSQAGQFAWRDYCDPISRLRTALGRYGDDWLFDAVQNTEINRRVN
jgi:hypothetical protein